MPAPAPGPPRRAPVAGETLATRPQVFAGLDRMVMPDGAQARGAAWLGLLLLGWTFRVAGAYLQFASDRHWHGNVLALRDQGWGVGAIFLGDSRETYVRKVRRTVVGADGQPRVVIDRFFDEPEKARWRSTMTAARGTAHAQAAKQLAQTAGMPAGSVVWFDNEDPSDVVLVDHEHAYYAAFLAEIAVTRRDQPAYRPGLYAHQRLAAQLLARHPEVWIWEVDYGNNVNRVDAPPMRAPTRADPRPGLDPANADAVIRAFRVVPEGGAAGSPWGCWPVWRQWQGNNDVNLPPRTAGSLTPVKKWDWNSSLVRDPADPAPTPRLAVAAGGPAAWVARLEDLDAVVGPDGRRQEPRRGRLTMRLPGGRPVEVPTERGWQLHPSSSVVPVVGAGAAEMIVAFTLDELGSTVWDARQWSPVRPLWTQSVTAAPRVPHAVAAAAPSPRDLHVVWAATGQQLWGARRPLAGRWGDPARIGGNLVLHPFGRIAAAPVAGALHVLAVDEGGHLVHAAWAPPAAWPSAVAAPIGGDAILPAGHLALVAGDAVTLVAVALGADMRLRRWHLRASDPRARWSAASPLGRPEDTMHPQTAVGVHQRAPGTVVVTAIAGDGRPQRFTLEATGGWTATTATALDVAPGVGAVHPLSDLPSLPDGRLLVSVVLPGTTDAAVVDPITGAAAELP